MPDATILTADELASIRRPYRAARLLPGRAYHDPAIHDWERERFLRHDWVVVGRQAEAPDAGTYFTTELDGEPLLIVRGRDDRLRAFYNVCQHRGTAVVEEPCGTAVRFQCPYHAWIYDLEGRLVRAKHTDEATIARPDFDPSDAIAFWDLTNSQDWHVCELQQRGTASRSWVSGRYSNLEESVHAFDLMVADRYAGEGFVTRRTVVQRDASLARDAAPALPADASGNGNGNGNNHGSNGHLAARATARSKAATSTTSSGAPEH